MLQSGTRTAGQSFLSVTGNTPLTGMTLTGRGVYFLAGCSYTGTAEITVSGHATKLEVNGSSQHGGASEGGMEKWQLCVKVMDIAGNYHVHLVRKE